MTTLTAKERAEKKAKVKEVTEIIRKLLIEDARYRDCDALLINRVQRDEIIAMGLDAGKVSLNDFFRIRLEKKISSEDTITRLRREVQEYYPETRGDNYKKRQSKQTDVQDDLHDVENEIASKSDSKSKQPAPEKPQAPMAVETCDNCQGTGKYEAFECNVCGGTGEVVFK